jgi:large conductance mechanosensitive channel
VLKGFKDFVLRGNVIDLAVAVIIGTAFGLLVSQFGKSFLEPLIKLASGGGITGGALKVETGDGPVYFNWGAFLNAGITFLITATTLYFGVVAPMNALAKRRKQGEEPEPQRPAEDILLLQQIRDALVEQNARTASKGSAGQ